eukprot:4645561-Ditylum_brightwellii.AAC.1
MKRGTLILLSSSAKRKKLRRPKDILTMLKQCSNHWLRKQAKKTLRAMQLKLKPMTQRDCA